ncbi:MAG: tyrosine-protein kinase family protein, partial [Planctomycetota bacterium]
QQEEGREHVNTFLIPVESENLWVLPSGPPPPTPISVLESKAMVDMIRDLREEYDIVLFDTPPITDVSDVLTLATRVDTCLLVVGSGLSDRRRATWAKQLLSNVRADTCGALLNFVSVKRGGQYYYYYASGYYGKTVRES